MFVFIWNVYVFSTNLHTHLHKKSLTNTKRELSAICLQEPHLLALSQIPAKNMREKRPIKVHKKALCPYKENCHEIPGILQKRPIKEPFNKALRICEYTCRKFIFRKYVPDPLRSAYVKEKHQKSPFCMSTDLSRIPARICAGSVDGCRRTGFEPAGARTVIE